MTGNDTLLRCATWNIHRARGADGCVDPPRCGLAIVGTPALADADVLVLTEADAERPPYRGLLDVSGIAAATGMRHVPGDCAALRWGVESHGFLGTVVLVRAHLAITEAFAIDLPGVYPRGAVIVELAGPLRIVATHLSLTQVLRIAQMRVIGQFLARRPRMRTVLIGDLNEWRPWGGLALSARSVGTKFTGPARPTFPARLPILPLDRVLCNDPGTTIRTTVLHDRIFRVASDHLPLVAEVSFA